MTTKTIEPDLGDLERSAELIERFLMDGDDTDAYRQQVALIAAEYDIGRILTALLALATGARSAIEHDPGEVVGSMWRIVAEYAVEDGYDNLPAKVLDEIERSAG